MNIDKPLKIMIVDDEKGITRCFKEYFSRKGFVVFEVNDGKSAIEIFEKERPRICFIDVWMASGTHEGVDILKRIKEIEESVYCIMMGPCSDEENTAMRLKELGALHFINGRLDMEDFDRYIKEIENLIVSRS